MTTDGGSAGTAGDRFRDDAPTPHPRPDTADPAEPGRRTTRKRSKR